MQAILRAFCAKIRTFARKNEREPSRTAPSFSVCSGIRFPPAAERLYLSMYCLI